MLMEIMGLHLPGASFVNPEHAAARRADPRRDARGRSRSPRSATTTRRSAQMVDERAMVNGVVGLHATGGSTNHTLHLVAMARAAGIQLTWDDFADLSEVVPLLCPRLPERQGRREPLPRRRRHGLPDPRAARRRPAARGREAPCAGDGGLARYRAGAVPRRRRLSSGATAPTASRDETIAAPRRASRSRPTAGCKLLDGNLGRAVIKVSAVKPEHQVIEAPALVFHDQDELQRRLQAPASWTATSSPWCASRARRPTACRSCTS